MIRFVKFTYDKEWGYLQDSSSDHAYGILGGFFTEEVGSDVEEIKEWMIRPDMPYYSGNITMVDKNEDASLRLYYIDALELTEESIEEIKRKTGVKHVEQDIPMSREDFLHILDGWATCRKYRFNEILIKRDNGVFWVEGVK